ncbi:MAG TPA: hypothetical protein VFQ35_00955 [Polyangiaceae bacterium]|nr:hypothetical protein [Polyangiaceae bacterium]
MANLGVSFLTATVSLSTCLTASFAHAAVGADAAVPANVATSAPDARTDGEQVGANAKPESSRAAESFNLGGRAFMAPTLGVGALGVGFDETYSVLPNLALGGQYVAYVVDQGADPQYCERCILDGKAALVFAEGRLWPEQWATPYARVGGGLSFVNGQRKAYDSGYGETDVTLLAEAGVELHYRWFSARAFGFRHDILGTKLDRDPLMGFGTQLGVRF